MEKLTEKRASRQVARGGRLSIVNRETSRVNHVFVYEFFDNLLHDTSDCYWVANEGRCWANGAFIAWLKKWCRVYGRILRLIDYNESAFDAYIAKLGVCLSSDIECELRERLALAKQYHKQSILVDEEN